MDTAINHSLGGIMNISYKKTILAFVEFFALFFYSTCCSQAPIIKTQSNRLNWVEVSQGKFSTQIMFDFTQPVFFAKKLNKEKFRLKLSFPGMTLEQFQHTHVMTQLKKLKTLGLVANITLRKKEEQANGITLALDFAQETHIPKNKNHTPQHIQKNKLLIKWVTLESPNRLIIDIFTKQKLDELNRDNHVLLQAHNNAIMSDMPQKISYTRKSKLPKDLRIVIDAGHGGSQPGAQSFGLQEKTLTLDIAQRVRNLLKKSGFNAIMTRNNDSTLSLVERSELAAQLKADLFISIHVNASGKKSNTENGVETFYLDDRFIFPQAHQSGFVLMNLKNQPNLPTIVNHALKKNIQASRNLANSIQHNLIGSLQDQNINITNRGIKSDGFRVLLRSGVPAALVEVGFLTNKQEASRLAQESYRSVVARGIYRGIEKYLITQN